MSEQARAGQEVAGNVRRYARFGVTHTLRRWWTLRGVAERGDDLFVEGNVKLLRHPERVFLGSRVMLKEGVRLCPTNPDATIRIGDWTTVGYHVFVFAAASVSIGANCLVAPFCYIVDNDHQLARASLIREQKLLAEPVVVEDDVWLGTGVVLTRGAHVGRGAVVGAGSVVTRPIPAYAIAAGTPARVIAERE